ncbi:MAG: histidine phosphatase family protein [Clostridia bacterium]|nr:histidine phosphatase family protein [Clostridia bacterium]
MKDVIFIRHGATAGNLEMRYNGRTDEPLCEEGIRQAQELGKAGLRADVIFVSPMKRTIETAKAVFPNEQFIFTEGLREMDFGIFEGKTAEELKDSTEYRTWVDSGGNAEIPNGESRARFRERCVKAFDEAMKSVPDGACAAFVIHGGVIMAVLAARAVPKRNFYDYYLKNCGTLRGVFEGGAVYLETKTAE